MNLKYYLRGLGIGIIMTSLIMGIASGDGKESLTNEEIKERARALGMIEEGSALADLIKEDVSLSPSPVSQKEMLPGNSPLPEESPQETVTPLADGHASATSAGTPDGEESPSPVGEAQPSPARTPGGEASPSPTPTSVPSPAATAEPSPTAIPSPTATPSPTAAPSPKATSTPVKTPVPTGTPTPSPSPEREDEDSVVIQVVSGDTSYSVCRKLQEAGLITSASEYDDYLCENGYDKRINVGEFRIPKGAGKEQIAKIIARLE